MIVDKAQKIKIRLISPDGRLLRCSNEIVDAARRSGARVVGPIPLPTKRKKVTVNRSVHGNKKSMEQFVMPEHTLLIVIHEPTAKTIDELKKLNLPSGVDIKIEI